MADQFNTGDAVKWRWGDGWGRGTVQERYTDDVTCTIDGTEVKRKASSDEPAYRIRQGDGDVVLKSQTEIEAAD